MDMVCLKGREDLSRVGTGSGTTATPIRIPREQPWTDVATHGRMRLLGVVSHDDEPSCPHGRSALRELTSFRRMFPTVFEELSGGRADHGPSAAAL
jgi:hypothetical protein